MPLNLPISQFPAVCLPCQVEYDDGDSEVLKLKNERWRFVAASASQPTIKHAGSQGMGVSDLSGGNRLGMSSLLSSAGPGSTARDKVLCYEAFEKLRLLVEIACIRLVASYVGFTRFHLFLLSFRMCHSGSAAQTCDGPTGSDDSGLEPRVAQVSMGAPYLRNE